MGTLNLKFVQTYRDRHGRLRHYFRRQGSRSVPLPGLPGSEEFMAAYQAALGGERRPIGFDRTLPGTIDALIVSYYQSAEWNAFARKTRLTRGVIIERFRQQVGKVLVKQFRTDHLATMMKRIEKQSAKIQWLKTIRGLLNAAIPTLRNDNPTIGLNPGKMPKTKGHHSWTDEEITQYRAYWPLGTQQRLAMELALEGLSRRCEIVTLGPQHIKNGRIEIKRAKGNNDVDIEMTPELAAAVAAMPKDHLAWLITAHGKARTVQGLGDVFRRWATQAGLPAHCRLHGLKKGGMRRMANSGCTTHELAGASGHKTLSMLEKYTADFDRQQAADRAIAKRKANFPV